MNGAGDITQQPAPTCAEISELLVFYSCNEVSLEEKSRVDEHLAACAECREQLAQENLLVDALNAAPLPADLLDSSGVLLAQCRSELAEKIDDLHALVPQERWQPFGWLRRWMALRPAWSGAALVVFGVVLGTQLLPWWETATDVAGPAVNVLAAKLTDDQLSKIAVANIHVSSGQGAGTDDIQLHLNAEQPLVLSGNVDDHDVRRVLNFVVSNGDRSNTDVRLDCIDALRTRANDPQVRQSLLQAARKDPSVAIRIRALESLRDAADDAAVRATILGVLDHDASPGVRIEAVNLLVRAVELDERNSVAGVVELSAESGAQSGMDSVQTATRALTELAQKDPSRDVRLRSAAALRQLGARTTR
ncbi:MAG TPA: zf-HC2 domain-containing protein [Candidatus Dormibacteraeota bacterium]|nr:zf-HC2 domain-containing protein [Candidatus Dormibacteraeota bacterium]